jgi:hypothetical protein
VFCLLLHAMTYCTITDSQQHTELGDVMLYHSYSYHGQA